MLICYHGGGLAASGADASTNADPHGPNRSCQACTQAAAGNKGIDPDANQWRSEAIHEALQRQWKALGKMLAHPETLDQEHLIALADPEYAGTSLRPPDLAVLYEDPTFIVQRPTTPLEESSTAEHHGLAGLQDSLEQIIKPFAVAEDIRTKFKVFRVAEDADSGLIQSICYVQLFGKGKTGRLEINTTWQSHWRPAAAGQGSAPQLLAIRVTDYEQVNVREGHAGPLLADCTVSVLGHNRSFEGQVRRGVNYWMDRLDYRAGVDMQGHQGLAVGDINGDALDDVYLCQNGALPNRLFIQNPDGTATERSAAAGLDLLTGARGVLLLDLDNDGDQDVTLSGDQRVFFLENYGKMRFRLRAGWQSPSRLFSLSAADFDNDGDLDVYACGLVEKGQRPVPVPYHDANNGGRNTLLANEGSWQFRDVTDEVGLGENNSRFSYASSWEDYDNDGDQDLYVANDFGRNNLYRNDGGRFVDVASLVGAEDLGAGMSATWGDYNADGHMDLYVSNMFSSAGGRIAFQRDFGRAYSDKEKTVLQRHARGNTLLVNRGNGTFADVSLAAHVTMGRWAWASTFVDLNNDGLEDLLVANGFITGDDTKDL